MVKKNSMVKRVELRKERNIRNRLKSSESLRQTVQRAADIIKANRVTFAELSLRTKKSSVSINPFLQPFWKPQALSAYTARRRESKRVYLLNINKHKTPKLTQNPVNIKEIK